MDEIPISKGHVHVHALQTGTLELLTAMLFSDGSKEESVIVPVFSFYIYHPTSDSHILFDAGLMKDLEAYPPEVIKHFPTVFKPIVPQDVTEILEKHNIESKLISHVIISHPHWDHTGDLRKFPHSTIVYGHGTQAFTRPGYPTNPTGYFLESDFPDGRTRELREDEYTVSIGPYGKAHDFFGDGSLYLIDSSGHMPGHTVALLNSEKGGWILLAGDSAHHLLHLTAYNTDKMCWFMHHDKEKAQLNIERMGKLQDFFEEKGQGKVKICLAHVGNYEEFERLG